MQPERTVWVLDSQVIVGELSRNAPTWCAPHESNAHEIGLHDALDRLAFFADSHRQRVESDWSAAEALEECLQHRAVKPVEPEPPGAPATAAAPAQG